MHVFSYNNKYWTYSTYLDLDFIERKTILTICNGWILPHILSKKECWRCEYGWGEWGDWSDMAPIITQVAPVEASILSVPSLMCFIFSCVEGATNILWYINDKLISESHLMVIIHQPLFLTMIARPREGLYFN
jgi:hypothetical protein